LNIYDYQRLVGKINDIKELRDQFIVVFDLCDKQMLAKFGMLYKNHILELTGFVMNETIQKAFDAVNEWIDGKTSYHKARNITFKELYQEVKESKDEIQKRYLKTIAQLTCIPHVKAHALWATDMAITLINQMFPNNLEKVKKERMYQIDILKRLIDIN